MSLVIPVTRPLSLAPGASIRGLRQLVSSTASVTDAKSVRGASNALSAIPNKTLARSLVLLSLMQRRWLLRPCLAMLEAMSHPKLSLMNPDKNGVLRIIVRKTIYDHFAAGTCESEVAKSSAEIKRIGYGVIMGYAKEFVLEDPTDREVETDHTGYLPCHYDAVQRWKESNLQTLRMIESGDFLSVK
jgi:proline dehydrogenase